MAIPNPKDWIAAYAKVQKLADADLLAVLNQAFKDIDRMLRAMSAQRSISEAVRIEQLLTVQRHILRQQAEVFARLGDIIEQRRAEAALAASNLGSAIDDVLLEALGDPDLARNLRTSLAASAEQGVEAAVARMTLSEVPLSQRIYNTQAWMDGRIQRGINSALARGLSAREFAKEARDWFDPKVPGGVRYASMRTARSEINNAFHATSIKQAAEKPWINQMKWTLSSSHPKPDLCDQYAAGGKDGDGIYAPKDVPRKPHPHCFCVITPVSPDEDAFLDGLLAGKYDKYLKDKALPQPRTTKPTATPRVSTAKPTATPKKAAGPPALKPKAVSAKLEAHLRDINKAVGKPRQIVHDSMMNQAKFCPRAMSKMGDVEVLNGNALERWYFNNGRSALGGYDGGRITLTPHAFSKQYDLGFKAELKSGWSSKCGHSAQGSLMAHELGHHMDDFLEHSLQARQAVWKEMADTFGLVPPALHDNTSLYIWVRRNKDLLEKEVSIYGAKNQFEIIAEIWAEFTTNPSARPAIKRIGRFMQRIVEEEAR
jgi:hypothetical protein